MSPMVPFRSARRAEDFAVSLTGRSPSRPLDEELQSLVSLVQVIRDSPPVEVRPDFATDLRARLLTEAEQVLRAAPIRHRAAAARSRRDVRRRRLTSLTAAACVTIGAGVGVAAASQSALPGETLYPVKRGIERVELTLSGGGQGRGDELLDQAETRLAEAQDLTVRSGDDPRSAAYVGDTLQDFETQASDGGQELIRAFEEDGDDAAIVRLRTFVSDTGARLESLAGSVPPQAEDDLAAAGDALTELDAAARAACPTCSQLAPLQLSSAVLQLRGDVDAVLEGLQPDQQSQRTPSKAPGEAPGEHGAQQPGAALPTGALPTLPPGGAVELGGGGNPTTAVQPQPPDLTAGPGGPAPEVDLGVTTVTVPDVLGPSGPVPSLVEPVETVLQPVETVLQPVETLLRNPLGGDN